MRVAVVDYGSGNLQSVIQSLQSASDQVSAGDDIQLTARADDISRADRIVLPGVGSFADCAKNLRQIEDLENVLNDAVLKRGVPFLGICVGMQLMADRGFEDGDTEGLGWIHGDVVNIDPAIAKLEGLKIPHMGWNGLDFKSTHPVFNDIEQGHAVYFVHGYHMNVEDQDHVLGKMFYGSPLVAAIGRDNMIGMQFHPEKSQRIGQLMLMNWLKWKP